MIKAIEKSKLPQLWKILASTGELYLPVSEGPAVSFRPWQEGRQVNLEAVNSTVSPKELFLPRDEVYLEFAARGQKLELQPAGSPASPLYAFGLRSCDLKALELLDLVFLKQEPVDELYRRRREAATTVAVACREPDPFCFCDAFGIDPADAPGADVMAWWDNDRLVMEARSAKGEDLFTLAAEVLSDHDGAAEPPAVRADNFSLQLDGLAEKLTGRFEDPVWDDLYRSCLGCGTCTFICPTCYCFDVQDYGHQEAGHRFRCWDSCMFKEFTVMAGGHNPRPTRKERVRNRFLHKLKYFHDNYNQYACVGCGRCLRSCPVNLDIVRVIRALGGETVAKS